MNTILCIPFFLDCCYVEVCDVYLVICVGFATCIFSWEDIVEAVATAVEVDDFVDHCCGGGQGRC